MASKGRRVAAGPCPKKPRISLIILTTLFQTIRSLNPRSVTSNKTNAGTGSCTQRASLLCMRSLCTCFLFVSWCKRAEPEGKRGRKERKKEKRERGSTDPLHLGLASTLIHSRNKRIRTSNKPPIYEPWSQQPLPLHGRSHRTVSRHLLSTGTGNPSFSWVPFDPNRSRPISPLGWRNVNPPTVFDGSWSCPEERARRAMGCDIYGAVRGNVL